MSVFIKGISYYLPEKVLTNEDLVLVFPEWSVEKVASKIGIRQRHIAAENETAADMAVAAGSKLIEEYKVDKTSIDFILLCTQSPDYFLPTSSCLIQERLKLRTSIGALDFNQGCSGFIYGLSLAKGLICGSLAKNVMLLTAETYSKYIHASDKGNRTIFGDAAAATLISSDGFAELMDFSLGTDGSGAKNLIVETGGLRCANAKNIITWDEGGNPISPDHLYMNGAEIFNFTLATVPLLIKDILSKNNLLQENIDLFVLHQANRYMMEFLRKKLKIDPDKFYYYLENVGNTVSSTIPIALKEGMDDGSISQGSKVLLAGFGVGYSWGGTVLKF
jgi:3-oxoacyl-[acyl-carrier-protein] synthase III